MTSTGRVARLTALALATGTLVAAGAGTAGAASKTTTTFTANGGGSVVNLNLNLPVALPGLPQSLTQKLIATASNVRTSGPGAAPAAITTAMLGSDGNIPVVSPLLNKSVKSVWGGQTDPAQGSFPANALLQGGALVLNSVTNNPDVQSLKPVALSNSSVANLRIADAAGLQKVLNQIVGALTQNLQGVIGVTPTGDSAAAPVAEVPQVVDLVGGIVEKLTGVDTSGLSQPAKDALATLTSLVDNLPQVLSQKLTAAAADDSLLKIGLIQSSQDVTHTGNTVTSHASNIVESISLLGGLATLDSLTSEATASLGDAATAPKASSKSDIVKLHLADVLDLQITSELQSVIKSGVLPATVTGPLQDAVNQVLALVGDALGVAIHKGTTKEQASSNRSFAQASPIELVVQPLGFAKPLIDIALVQSQAEVVKAQSTTPTTVITPGKTTSRHQFAPTGANFGLTAPIAISLMGIALYARRRRLALQG